MTHPIIHTRLFLKIGIYFDCTVDDRDTYLLFFADLCPTIIFSTYLLRPFFRLFARFFTDLSRKIDEKSMKKTMHFSIASLVFLSMATLTKYRILRYESYFSIFCDSLFFLKKHQKNSSKIQATFSPSKNTKKCSQVGRFGSQNGPEAMSEEPNISKLCKKVVFRPPRFLSVFSKKCLGQNTFPILLPSIHNGW